MEVPETAVGQERKGETEEQEGWKPKGSGLKVENRLWPTAPTFTCSLVPNV